MCKVLPSNMTVFGDRAFKEMVMVRGHKGEALIQQVGILVERE